MGLFVHPPHQVTICALNEGDDPLNVCSTLPVLACDSHRRGTFQHAEKVYNSADSIVVETSSGVQQVSLSGNARTTRMPKASIARTRVA